MSTGTADLEKQIVDAILDSWYEGDDQPSYEIAAWKIVNLPAIKEALSLKMQMDAAIEEFEARGGVAQDYKPN